MDLTKAKGETWNSMEGERSLPLFNDDEIEKATAIVRILEGLTIAEANSILNKVSQSIDQLIVI